MSKKGVSDDRKIRTFASGSLCTFYTVTSGRSGNTRSKKTERARKPKRLTGAHKDRTAFPTAGNASKEDDLLRVCILCIRRTAALRFISGFAAAALVAVTASVRKQHKHRRFRGRTGNGIHLGRGVVFRHAVTALQRDRGQARNCLLPIGSAAVIIPFSVVEEVRILFRNGPRRNCRGRRGVGLRPLFRRLFRLGFRCRRPVRVLGSGYIFVAVLAEAGCGIIVVPLCYALRHAAVAARLRFFTGGGRKAVFVGVAGGDAALSAFARRGARRIDPLVFVQLSFSASKNAVSWDNNCCCRPA